MFHEVRKDDGSKRGESNQTRAREDPGGSKTGDDTRERCWSG